MALLQHDLLIIDQVRGFLSNDFSILDAHGRPAGYIRTEGSGLNRLFMGNRQFTVLDADGTPMVRLDDVVTFGRDRMNIMAPDGQLLAELVRRISFLRSRFTITLADGTAMDIEGKMFDREFHLATAQMGEIARVTRSYSGIGQALLGRERYALQMAGFTEPWLRATIIGCVIAIDLCRQKDKNSD